MQWIFSFIASNAIVQTWQRLWFALKAALVLGAVVFAVSELTQQSNHALFSYSKSAGEGAAGEAQVKDTATTKRDIEAGKGVTGAERKMWAEVESQAAQAEKTRSEANAYNETEAQLLAKKTLNIPLTTTEDIRLSELQTRRAEAKQKIAAATAAEAQAKADRVGAEVSSKLIEDMQKGHGLIGDMLGMVGLGDVFTEGLVPPGLAARIRRSNGQ